MRTPEEIADFFNSRVPQGAAVKVAQRQFRERSGRHADMEERRDLIVTRTRSVAFAEGGKSLVLIEGESDPVEVRFVSGFDRPTRRRTLRPRLYRVSFQMIGGAPAAVVFMAGRWLADAGFCPGTTVHVVVTRHGELYVRRPGVSVPGEETAIRKSAATVQGWKALGLPQIRLLGNWVGEAGFPIGQEYGRKVVAEGLLLLRAGEPLL